MSKRDSAPTFGWVVSSRITKWLAGTFLFLLLVLFIAVWTVRYSIQRDCYDLYNRDMNVFGYWLHIEAGSTAEGCPNPYAE